MRCSVSTHMVQEQALWLARCRQIQYLSMLIHLLSPCFSNFSAILLLKSCTFWGCCDIVLYIVFYRFSAFLHFVVVPLYFWWPVQQGPGLLAHLLQSQVMYSFSCFGLRNFRCALQIQTSDENHTFNFLSEFIYRIAVILNSGWLNWCLFFLCMKLCLLPVFLQYHRCVAFDSVLPHHL